MLGEANPKACWGAAKANFWGVPSSALIWLGNVMGSGGYKYGFYNYRDTKISASTYHDAIQRHLALYFDGEDLDPLIDGPGNPPGSGAPHLAHVMACCALLLDAQENGMMVDDRSKTGNVRRILDQSAKAYAMFQQQYDKFKAEGSEV